MTAARKMRHARRGYPRIKAAIVLLQQRQRVIADLAAIPAVRLSRIISGKGSPPTRGEKARLSRVLHRPTHWLFDEDLEAPLTT